MNDLDEYRKQIDQIDDNILELLAQRFKVVEQVARFKKANNMAALQSSRWNQVLDKLKKRAEKLNLNSELTVDIWNRIHEQALAEENKTIKNRGS
jgi:chorismate mutase